jgi:hypothetical protein
LETIMQLEAASDAMPDRVLVVADWTVDPHAVVAACRRRAEQSACAFGLLVPAWLHGLDWVGDPAASVPCAQRQVASVGQLARAGDLSFDAMSVGDPDPLAAICDALADWPAEELLLCTQTRGLTVPHAFDLAHRTRRLTGLPVRRIDLPGTTIQRSRHLWRVPSRHCALDRPQAA